MGRGGIRAAAQAVAASETTVRRVVFELETGKEPLGRVWRPGGGRKRATETDPGLWPALLSLVEPDERGDPMSPLPAQQNGARTKGSAVLYGHSGRGSRIGDVLVRSGRPIRTPVHHEALGR